MGAKTKIEQAPTMTPQQLAMMNSRLRNAQNFTQGMVLGQGWGGPRNESYAPNAGYGGKMWGTPQGGAPQGINPALNALQAPVPSAGGMQASNPAAMNPTSPASYSNRDQIVTPFINPFRRNLGG